MKAYSVYSKSIVGRKTGLKFGGETDIPGLKLDHPRPLALMLPWSVSANTAYATLCLASLA
jgi:hypothetical protein